MDVADVSLIRNRDWDPGYLRTLFDEDFYEFGDLWKSNVQDEELVRESNRLEHYCPITEDISLDDNVLCEAVEHVEEE